MNAWEERFDGKVEKWRGKNGKIVFFLRLSNFEYRASFLNPVSRDQDKCVAYIFNFLSTIVTEIFIEKRERR